MSGSKSGSAQTFKNLIQETKVHYYKSSGPGGQHKNKRETAVRLIHIPTGLSAVATEFRSQVLNKELAFNRLKKRIYELTKKIKPRKLTKVSISVKEKILKKKKIHSEVKKLRKKIEYSEEE